MRDFCWHPGIDPIAVARAAWRNFVTGRVGEGGSTITQQVAKLLDGARSGAVRSRTWRPKIREAVIALRLEHRLTKDEILALVPHLAPYGNRIEAPMRAQAPTSAAPRDADAGRSRVPRRAAATAVPLNPWRDPAAGSRRQTRILDGMRGASG